MEFKTAKAVIDKMRNFQLKIQFAGGEPMMNFSLAEEIIAYTKAEKIDAVFQMQTNGTLIDGYTAKRIKELGIAVGVSLDGTPDINEITRGKTDSVLNGIRCLGAEGIIIGLNAVVTSVNVSSLDKLIELAFYFGNVGGIGLDLLRCAGRGSENYSELIPDGKMLKSGLNKMLECRNRIFSLSGRKIEIREFEKAERRFLRNEPVTNYCYASCGRSLVVLPDGEIYQCGSLLKPEYLVADSNTLECRETDSLVTEISENCHLCRYERICPKGCPSRKIRNRDNLECIMLKTAFEIAERNMK
jgi:uncharacterized protein